MSWGDDHHGKTRYTRWENALHDAYYAETDDLCDETCARCGTDTNLHRPVDACVDGVWCGEVVCETCVPITEESPC